MKFITAMCMGNESARCDSLIWNGVLFVAISGNAVMTVFYNIQLDAYTHVKKN
jgi:hypothetical protein